MDTVSWGELQARDAELAATVEARLTRQLCYFATVRADGHPRVHPVGVNVRGSALIVPMAPSSPKGHDLRRNGRYAIHCSVEDDEGGGGEVLVSGIAEEVDPLPELRDRGWITFDLRIGEVLVVVDDGRERAVTRWRADP